MSLNKVQLNMIWKGQGRHQADALPASIQTHSQTLTKKTSRAFPLLPFEPQKLISTLCRPKALLPQTLVANSDLISVPCITIDLSVEADAALISSDWLSCRDGWNKTGEQTHARQVRLSHRSCYKACVQICRIPLPRQRPSRPCRPCLL